VGEGVEVAALSGVLAGDAWAWAGMIIDSMMGLIQLDGMMIVAVRPPTVNTSRTRRRVMLPSLI
jgi:hypothetical protein